MEHTLQVVTLNLATVTLNDCLAWSQYRTVLEDGCVVTHVRIIRTGGKTFEANVLDIKELS